jgi:hypothetical protein
MPIKALLGHFLSRGAALIELTRLETAGALKRSSFTVVLQLPPGFRITDEQRGFELKAAAIADISISLRDGKYIINLIARSNPEPVTAAYKFLQGILKAPNN